MTLSSLLRGATLIAVLIAAWLAYPQPDMDLSDEASFPWALAREKFTGDDNLCPLEGVNIVITGATSGIGKSLTLALLNMGGTVIALGRSPSKLEQLALEAKERTNRAEGGGARNRCNPNDANSSLIAIKSDFNDLQSVSDGADKIIRLLSDGEHGRGIDLLINNAGMYQMSWIDNFDFAAPTTAQGFDQTFGVNYLSHFLLTEKLLPLLRKSTDPGRRGTIVQVSSSYHWAVDGSCLRIDSRPGSSPIASVPGGSSFMWRDQRSYANSKLAQILHARALARREEKSVRVISACPAWVGTGIGGEIGSPVHSVLESIAFPVDGWGLASILKAAFEDNFEEEKNFGDYYGNTPLMDVFQVIPHAILRSRIFFASRMRDLFGCLAARMVVLPLQKFAPKASVTKTSPDSYDSELQESLYVWSKYVVSEWL